MTPSWIAVQTDIACTFLFWFLAIIAARARCGAPRGLRWVLDGVAVLPLFFSPASCANVFFWARIQILACAVEGFSVYPLLYLMAWMGFRRVNPETVDAARLQGMGSCGIFWRVWFSAAWPWLAAGLAVGLLREAIALALAYA